MKGSQFFSGVLIIFMTSKFKTLTFRRMWKLRPEISGLLTVRVIVDRHTTRLSRDYPLSSVQVFTDITFLLRYLRCSFFVCRILYSVLSHLTTDPTGEH